MVSLKLTYQPHASGLRARGRFRRGSIRGGGDTSEELGYFEPVVHADEAGGHEVVRCGIEQALPLEALQVSGLIVDEEVGAKDRLVAAEDVVRGRDEGKVALQPAVFGAERVGHGHGLRGDVNFKTRGKVFEHRLRLRHERKVFEEIFSIEKGAKLRLPVERRDFP